MNKKVIFILEDDPDIRLMIQIILSDMDFNVSAYGTVHEFNQVIEKNLPDLFVLDVMLPDGNGLDVCKQLKSYPDASQIPVLIMSANTALYELNAAGCGNEFIAKPFDIVTIREKVLQLV